LRFLAAKQLFCCYAPTRLRVNKGDSYDRNQNIKAHSNHSSMDSAAFRTLIPTEVCLQFNEQRAEMTGFRGNRLVWSFLELNMNWWAWGMELN
jgi:hypothetical protein